MSGTPPQRRTLFRRPLAHGVAPSSMYQSRRDTTLSTGFTIVELLIVVVIVAVLAAIVIITYGGVQGRANDSVVQSDLRQISQQLNAFYVDNSVYPTSYNLSVGNPRLSFAKNSYQTSGNAVLYCRNTDGSRMALIGKSKSGTVYYITDSNLTARVLSGGFPSGVAADCPSAGLSEYAGSIWIHNGAWQTWVNG